MFAGKRGENETELRASVVEALLTGKRSKMLFRSSGKLGGDKGAEKAVRSSHPSNFFFFKGGVGSPLLRDKIY